MFTSLSWEGCILLQMMLWNITHQKELFKFCDTWKCIRNEKMINWFLLELETWEHTIYSAAIKKVVYYALSFHSIIRNGFLRLFEALIQFGQSFQSDYIINEMQAIANFLTFSNSI